MIQAPPSGSIVTTAVLGTTGLTPGIQILDNAGNVNVARATTGIIEAPAGSGIYVASFSAPTTAGRYVVVWDTGSVTPTTVTAEDLIVDSAVNARGVIDTTTVTVSYIGPVATSGDVTITQGDDYNNTDSRALTWTTSSSSDWPTLTGATVTFTIRDAANTIELAKAATVVTPTGATKAVRVELTAAETAALAIGGAHQFMLRAALTSGRIVTLTTGRLNVLDPA